MQGNHEVGRLQLPDDARFERELKGVFGPLLAGSIDRRAGEYCLPVGSIDTEALKALFTDVEMRRDEISREVEKVVAECSQAARAQLTELSEVLFSAFCLPTMA